MADLTDPLSTVVGGDTVAAHLRRAIESGALVEHEDGTLQLVRASASAAPDAGQWVFVDNGPRLGCQFLGGLLFQHAYARAAVPHGCRACYKVKVAPRTLRGLFAGWALAKEVPCLSKWGTDLNNRYSQDVYGGYIYTSGLEQARTVYAQVRPLVDQEPALGPETPITIKRGCSEFEAELGPSDQYQFPAVLASIEASLLTRFRPLPVVPVTTNPIEHWLDVAFRIGDDTYLDFTAGRRLRPAMKSYAP